MNKAFVILICASYSLISNTYIKHSEDEITELKIVYVNSGIETIYDISCDNFNYAFKDMGYMEKKITDKKQLEKFSSSLNNFQRDSHVSSIDTRAKIYITYADGKKSVLCVDQFGYSVMKNNYVGMNKKIILFIKEICKGFE